MITVHGLKVKLDSRQDRLVQKLEGKLRIPKGTVSSARIVKESLDAREKPVLYRVYSLEIESAKSDEWLIEACKRANMHCTPENPVRFEIRASESAGKSGLRPVIAGFGPCGMFAALALAEYGLKPIVLERGGSMEKRALAVERFWQSGKLDPECNVQFGEGGAGTFSDGKLTTGTKSPYSQWILERFVDAGASPKILYAQKPHIGTDVLREVVVNIRKRIEALGGEVRFGCRLEKIEFEECLNEGSSKASEQRKDVDSLRSVKKVSGVFFKDHASGKTGLIKTDTVVLALGHSARDTIRNLYGQGLLMEQKPFSMGVRIEHPQSMIDISQYAAPHEELGIGAADYKLNVKTKDGRGVYTFCMCPGGYVINSASDPETIVTNGMSNSDRGSGTANAALLADVLPSDYPGEFEKGLEFAKENDAPEWKDPSHPLAGLALAENYERLAFIEGGKDFKAPAQTVGSFLGKALQETLPEDAFTTGGFKPGVRSADLRKCLPCFVSDALEEALPMFGRKIKGFDDPRALMTGIESRSSSPVRIKRDAESLMAKTVSMDQISGLFPAGEGAGYAGGIMSAAADGVRIAVRIAESE